ncbi:hypothetical protein AB0F72_08835 [Actinoplanes sp. NPDC023936]|uniref:hypothetical protein n=1 Tax=Actinoplanes sp. NPDC023936 TaxID=3154910 RepID=UPI00340A0178
MTTTDNMPSILAFAEDEFIQGTTGAGKNELQPLLVFTDEFTSVTQRAAEPLPMELTEIRQRLVDAGAVMERRHAATAQPTGPARDQQINTFGSLFLLAGALTGLAFTALNDPAYVPVAIPAAYVAAVIGAIVMLRTPARNV